MQVCRDSIWLHDVRMPQNKNQLIAGYTYIVIKNDRRVRIKMFKITSVAFAKI